MDRLWEVRWNMCLRIHRAFQNYLLVAQIFRSQITQRRKSSIGSDETVIPKRVCALPLPTEMIHQTSTPDSKVHGANMGPIWGRQDSGRSRVGPMNFAIWDFIDVSVTNVVYLQLTGPCILHITLFNQTHSSEIIFVNGWPGSSGIGIIAKGLFHHGNKSSCVFKRIQANKTYIICPFN